MKTYTFEQIYFWGDNWYGKLQIPESAKFYKDYGFSDGQQNWYIFIPTKDITNIDDVKLEGCIQVRDYRLLDYTILYLANIIPNENWLTESEYSMQSYFKDWFANTYLYRYATAQYNVEINKDAKNLDDIVHSELIQPETLLACYKIKGLSSDAEIICTRVNLKHRIELKDDPFIDSITLRLCDIPPQDSYDSKEKLILNHDETLYDLSFNEVTSKLY